ncbi:MAG TPA: hypothetical protein VFJ76_07700 [Solirubrobacterales bacterium]|nr:hypothetical protein [Solirubrobacterales bacterium]
MALLLFLAWQNVQWTKERRELLQRLQAPEVAVNQFAERPKHPPVAPVPVDDDAAFAEARERREALNGDGD